MAIAETQETVLELTSGRLKFLACPGVETENLGFAYCASAGKRDPRLAAGPRWCEPA